MTPSYGTMKTKSSISNLVKLSCGKLSLTKAQSVSVIALMVLFLLPGLALADVGNVFYVQGPGGVVLANASIIVPESCTVTDSVGVPHDFSGHKAVCALQAAKTSGIITGFQVTDTVWGLRLDSVNGIVNDPLDMSGTLWQLWQNGSSADFGVQDLALSAGDDFQLTYGPWPTAIIRAPEQAPGGVVVTDIYPRRVRVEDAVSFLVANQQDDGSFGHALFTDWVAIALGAYTGNSTSAFYAKNALMQWMGENPIPEGSVLTDFERRAMALMALGIDPYAGAGANYIQGLLKGFDGAQFGNVNLVNDDIFALLVLLRAGYQEQEEPVASALGFVLGAQRENGSFGDTDMTAAVIQLLDLVSSSKERDEAVSKAKAYLERKQESTGGFGNVYSTSWVLQAISAMQGNGDSWVIDDRTPEHFLALRQASDGGLLALESKENRIWATSYAIPAALGKPWGSVLAAFEKPSAVFSLQEEFLAPFAVQKDDSGAAAFTIDTIKQQITVLQQEVAVLQKLEYIQSELDRIALEVRAVGIRVVAFKVQQLAQNVQPAPKDLAAEPIIPQVSPVAKIQEPQVLSQDLSGITLVQEDVDASLAAEAKEAVGVQGLSPQLIILLVLIGGAVFVFSGGMNALLPLLRKTFSRV